MPLVRRDDSVLVVVDAQPGFYAYDGLSEDDAQEAAHAVTRIAWMAGLAGLLDTGVERNHCKGLTFEWLHTVDRAIETWPEASALGMPPWRLESTGAQQSADL